MKKPMLFNTKTLPVLGALIYLCSFHVAADYATELVAKTKPSLTDKNCEAVERQWVKPNSLTEDITEQRFTLLGRAKFSVLFWDIYESSLSTADGQRPFSHLCQELLFEIHYLRDISKKDLLDNTVSQWQHLSLKESEYSAFLPLLESIWQDIKKGDRLSMLTQQNKTVFYLNREHIGEIESSTFAKTFLGIWIDENTSEPKLRLKLLGDNV
jgi:hypothetical protein